MATRNEIAELYVANFGRAADTAGLDYWSGNDNGGTTPITDLTDIEDIANSFADSPEFAAAYDVTDREGTIEKMYLNIFNREADSAGLQYWVDSGIELDSMIIALLNGALGSDQEYINNRTEVALAFADAGLDNVGQAYSIMHDVNADYATVVAAIAAINAEAGIVVGQTYSLTAGIDTITANSADDSFNAFLSQNSAAGGVSNTLATSDILDGGAGDDSLYAELVPEYFGNTGNNQIDVQAKTASIESIAFEVVSDNVAVTVDAKDMTDVDMIGSSYSDGDLTIENLTTLTEAGEIRHTSDMTIVMDHTDNFNSDNDASDLTVYFDEDYLNTTTESSNSQLTINMINSLNLKLDNGTSLIEGFLALTFFVGEKVDENKITVDVTGAELSEVQGLIEAALTAAGHTTVTVSTYTEPAYFATNIYYEDTNTTYNAGDYAGDYTAFVLTNSGSEDLNEGGFALADGQRDGSLAYSQDDRESIETTLPISINVILEKVGRDGEGGDLVIGGKDQNINGDSDVDQNDGINIFDIEVSGNANQPSNLGTIASTNNSLTTVNVTDHANHDGAALTVRGMLGEGQELTTINATGFTGDFSLAMTEGTQQAVSTSFGTGNDSYNWESSEVNGIDSGKSYSISMGDGNDTVIADLDGDSVDAQGESFTLSTGSGDDTATVTGTAGVSDATTLALDNVNVNLGSGEDMLDLNTEIITTVNAGTQSDFVRIDADNAGQTTAANLGTWSIGDGTSAPGTDWADRVLYEATLTVNFAGFEETVTIVTNSASNFVASQADINAAVIDAIESNPELDRLLSYDIQEGTNGDQILNITSTVQGVNNLSIAVNQPVIVADALSTTGDTTISTAHYAALEAGLIQTGVIDSSAIPNNTEAEIMAVMNTLDGNLNETGAVAVGDLVLDSSAGTSSDNTAATSRAIVDMSTGANDLIALDSDQDSMDTLVFSDGWGSSDKVSVLNFDGTTNTVIAAVPAEDETQTITVTGVSAGESIVNGDLTITLAGGEVVTATVNANDADQAISDAIVVAINSSALNGAGNVIATNAGGTSTVVTVTYASSLGDVAATLVAENIATDATMQETTTGGAPVPAVTAAQEVTNVTFATNAAIGDTIVFDGTTITLADSDGSGVVELDEIAEQVAAGTYANFTVSDYDNSAGTVQFTAITAGADQSVVSGLAGVNMAAGDFTFSGATTAATVGFLAVGSTVSAGVNGLDAAVAIAEGNDILTFTAADESGTLTVQVDALGDGVMVDIDVALLDTDSAISVGTKAAVAIDAVLGADWTVTDNADGTVTLAKAASLGTVASTTYTDGAVDTAIADATETNAGVVGSVGGGISLSGDILDFNDFLDNELTTSGSTASASQQATTLSYVNATGTHEVVGSDVLVMNDFAGSGSETWAALDGTDVLNSILNDSNATNDYGNLDADTLDNDNDTATLLGNTVKSILMVENDTNAGEYKVFEVTASETTNEFTNVELVGTVDFGATQTTLTDNNVA